MYMRRYCCRRSGGPAEACANFEARCPSESEPVSVFSQPMRLTVATEDGNAFTLDVDAEWELENVQALLESDVRTGIVE